MAPTHSIKAVEQFFLKGGATQALFRWLDFRLFVAQKNLKLASANHAAAEETSVIDYLNQWRQQVTLTSPAMSFLWLVKLVIVVIGFSAMASVLNYSNQPLINIWVPLALFAFVPFLLTLVSVYFSVLSPTKQHVQGHPLLLLLINKLKLTTFLSYKNLLLPWLFWQIQTFAILFSASALLAFFVLATFQDYHFGWSSTLMTNNATMTHLMAVISWPWHWLIDAPTAELISQSRFGLQANTLPVQTQDAWWMTLVMAILFYGVLPRLLLALFLRQRFIKQLRSSIANSGDVEQFIVAQQHQVSRNPIQSEGVTFDSDMVSLPVSNIDLISWQQPDFAFPVVKNLGSDDWINDEQWLSSSDSRREHPVWIMVDPIQIPTGELADCIDMLQQNNTSVKLVLYPMNPDDPRYRQQQKSWQFFAQRQHIDLKEGHSSV